eukprot:TRINITY_DN9741_c0_g1_i3.p2 TRINITY_DN9741_c0_g1~~TRINITY_DN9741_c0_g1_i3.p2  ORF type:complete len:435 (-),score=101.82 TRINITY_DN9741_c0_g1_i3:51-1355(-)
MRCCWLLVDALSISALQKMRLDTSLNLGFVFRKTQILQTFFMDVISGKVNRYLSPEGDAIDSSFTRENLVTMWEQHTGRTGVVAVEMGKDDTESEDGDDDDSVWDDVKGWLDQHLVGGFLDIVAVVQNSVTSLFTSDPYRVTPGFLQQTWFCFLRAAQQNYRDGRALLLDNMIHLSTGLFLGIASNRLQYTGPLPEGLQVLCPFPLRSVGVCTQPIEDNFTSTGNLLGWGISFAAIAAAINTFGGEKVVYWREASSGLNPAAYYVGKLVADIPRLVLAATMFFIAYIFMFSPEGRFDHLFLIILMLYWCGFTAGYSISNLFRPEVAPLVGVGFALVWAIVFSGVNPRLSEVEDDFSESSLWIWDISYARWAVEAFYINMVTPYDYQEGIDTGFDFWSYDKGRFAECCFNMFLIGWFWAVIGFIALRFTNREKQV